MEIDSGVNNAKSTGVKDGDYSDLEARKMQFAANL